jgi:hypothetical protein
MINQDHNEQVFEFFQKCKNDNPEQYDKIAEKYPILTHRRWRTIRERERTAGLHPAPAHVNHDRYDEGEG